MRCISPWRVTRGLPLLSQETSVGPGAERLVSTLERVDVANPGGGRWMRTTHPTVQEKLENTRTGGKVDECQVGQHGD